MKNSNCEIMKNEDYEKATYVLKPGEFWFGKYLMVRPGIMKIYEHVSSYEECLAICERLLGKGDSRLIKFIQRSDPSYRTADD